jgi:hypothetical protein
MTRRHPKMDWDRVRRETPLFEAQKGSHIGAVARDEIDKVRAQFRGQPKTKKRKLDLWPKMNTRNERRQRRTCPDCGKAFYGLEQHRKDKHPDAPLTAAEALEALRKAMGT